MHVTDTANNDYIRNKKPAFNNAPFRSFISIIYNTFIIDNAENLDISVLMYNLWKYSDNYSMTSASLWNYYRDKVNDDANDVVMMLVIIR